MGGFPAVSTVGAAVPRGAGPMVMVSVPPNERSLAGCANSFSDLEAYFRSQIGIRLLQNRRDFPPLVFVSGEGDLDDLFIRIIYHSFGEFHPQSP
jgi:hypothetical protein